MEHDPNECLVVWPTDPSAGDLIAPQLRPQHACYMPALHVSEDAIVEEETFNAGGDLVERDVRVIRLPHVCHCGAILPVRDVEPAAQS